MNINEIEKLVDKIMGSIFYYYSVSIDGSEIRVSARGSFLEIDISNYCTVKTQAIAVYIVRRLLEEIIDNALREEL